VKSAHLGKRGIAERFSLLAGRERRRCVQHFAADGLQDVHRCEWGQRSQMVQQYRPQRPASNSEASLG